MIVSKPDVGNQLNIDRVMSPRQVVCAIGISRTSLYRLMAVGDFVKPIRLSKRRIGFKVADVNAWVDGRNSSKAKDHPKTRGLTHAEGYDHA